jgi:hypothetical protein
MGNSRLVRPQPAPRKAHERMRLHVYVRGARRGAAELASQSEEAAATQ